jgi:uncharacterized phiE125 gp8 family phage protein
MITRVVTQPPVEPVTLAEIKAHLRGITHSDHDEELSGLIAASRQHIERIIGRALVQQTRAVKYQAWPKGNVFELPYPPIQSVMSLKYTDTDGTEYTFSSDNYSVDATSEPGRLVLGYSKSWPSTTLHHPEYPIEITYVCGYPAIEESPPDYRANIPDGIKNAIKLDVERRYDKPPEGYAERLDQVIDILLAPYKVWWA